VIGQQSSLSHRRPGVGTPQTVAAQELRIECMFPADEATEIHHASLMADIRI
jgi:hypothetical protein